MLRQEQTHVGQFRCLRNYCLIPQTKSKQNLYITDVAWLSHHDWCIKYIRIMMIIMILTEGIWKLHIISVGPVIGRPICWVPFLVWLRVPRKTGQKNLECPFIWVVAKKKKNSTSHPTDPWILSRRVRRLRTPGINSKAAEVHRWSVAADQLVCFFEGSVPGVPHPMCFRMDGSVSIINGPWRKWRQWLCKKVLAANKWQNYIQKVAVICPLNFVNFVINFGNY